MTEHIIDQPYTTEVTQTAETKNWRSKIKSVGRAALIFGGIGFASAAALWAARQADLTPLSFLADEFAPKFDPSQGDSVSDLK